MAYNWKTTAKFTIGFTIAAYWVACSPKTFQKDPTADVCQNSGINCIKSGDTDLFEYTVKANGGQVDILIVDDNSGSMSFEQEHMADKFDTFLAQLDAQFVDYRIGIITSDISSAATAATYDDSASASLYNEPRAINNGGALQDGKLIPFPNGSVYLTPSSGSLAQREAWFKATIKRGETLTCEAFLLSYPSSQPPAAGLHTSCPSGDERGIFAANLFVKNNPSSFIRPNAALSIIFLADEDVRSGLYRNSVNTTYQLEANDEPTTLVNNVTNLHAAKTLTAHSIIVRPGDTACMNSQSNQMGPSGTAGITYNWLYGSIGNKYAEATNITGGILGDICANDYGSQLSNIASNIVDHVSDLTLACANPADLFVELNPLSNTISYNVSGKNLHFSQSLPPGMEAKLKYSCPTIQ